MLLIYGFDLIRTYCSSSDCMNSSSSSSSFWWRSRGAAFWLRSLWTRFSHAWRRSAATSWYLWQRHHCQHKHSALLIEQQLHVTFKKVFKWTSKSRAQISKYSQESWCALIFTWHICTVPAMGARKQFFFRVANIKQSIGRCWCPERGVRSAKRLN